MKYQLDQMDSLSQTFNELDKEIAGKFTEDMLRQMLRDVCELCGRTRGLYFYRVDVFGSSVSGFSDHLSDVDFLISSKGM